jgi:benzodiazapine receptor
MGKVKLMEILKLIISILVCQLAGFVGSIFTTPSVPTWYATLKKPAFTPSNSIFGPVWTTLFILMGISMYLIWKKGFQNRDVKIALFIFGAQLVLNILWSFLFFGLRCPSCAFVEIIILWIAILITILSFVKISQIAGVLLLPYIIWVSFAAVLNFSIWTLNK